MPSEIFHSKSPHDWHIGFGFSPLMLFLTKLFGLSEFSINTWKILEKDEYYSYEHAVDNDHVNRQTKTEWELEGVVF